MGSTHTIEGSCERRSQADRPHRSRCVGPHGVAGPAARVRPARGVGVGAERWRDDARADVEPSHSTATRVVPHQTCEDAGWSGTVGVIHSPPGGERCWYYFPTTQVASSDGQSFASQPYPVDAIMCGDHVVWINRDMAETQLPLAAER